jgi:hypothetical protein
MSGAEANNPSQNGVVAALGDIKLLKISHFFPSNQMRAKCIARVSSCNG